MHRLHARRPPVCQVPPKTLLTLYEIIAACSPYSSGITLSGWPTHLEQAAPGGQIQFDIVVVILERNPEVHRAGYWEFEQLGDAAN